MRATIRPSEPRITLDDIDLFDPELFRSRSPHASWRLLRQQAPVWPQESPQGVPFWSVTRYADVKRVIKDHSAFSSEHGSILAVLRGDPAGGRAINVMDPPRHAAIRLPAMRLLSTGAMLDREPRVRQLVKKLIEPLRSGGVHDLAELMLPLPLLAVGEVIGIPQQRWADIPRWTMAGIAPDDPAYAAGSVEQTLQTAHSNLFTLFTQLARERRARPEQDVISVLAQLQADGRRLTTEEILLNSYAFIMGANTTTPHVASHLLLAFAERPRLWAELRDDPTGADDAVAEGLRWATPTNHFVRKARHDVTLAGTRVAAGDLVCAWVASANRDEHVFADPFDFRPSRSPNPHLALGAGIHFCIGGPAANMVLRVLLEELLPLVERFEVAGEVRHLRSNFINGITSLPLAVHAARTRQPRRPAPVTP